MPIPSCTAVHCESTFKRPIQATAIRKQRQKQDGAIKSKPPFCPLDCFKAHGFIMCVLYHSSYELSRFFPLRSKLTTPSIHTTIILGQYCIIQQERLTKEFASEKVETAGNTPCISRLSERISVGQNPSEFKDAAVRVSLVYAHVKKAAACEPQLFFVLLCQYYAIAAVSSCFS